MREIIWGKDNLQATLLFEIVVAAYDNDGSNACVEGRFFYIV